MKKNINSNSVVNKYKLTPKDIKIIEKDAKGLINFIEENLNIDIDDDSAVLKWSVGSDDYMALCKYQMSVRSKLLEKFGSVFSLEQYMWCEDRNAILFVVFERIPISNDEIVKVSRHIYETAKQMGCHYLGVDIDVILDDDPRLPYSL